MSSWILTCTQPKPSPMQEAQEHNLVYWLLWGPLLIQDYFTAIQEYNLGSIYILSIVFTSIQHELHHPHPQALSLLHGVGTRALGPGLGLHRAVLAAARTVGGNSRENHIQYRHLVAVSVTLMFRSRSIL